MIFNTNTLNGWSFFPSRRSSNATNYGRSLLRWYGNGEDYPGVVGGFHVTLPGSSAGGARRIGPGRRKIKIALTGGSSLSPDHRRDDSRNPSQIQPCTAWNSTRYHTVNLTLMMNDLRFIVPVWFFERKCTSLSVSCRPFPFLSHELRAGFTTGPPRLPPRRLSVSGISELRSWRARVQSFWTIIFGK